MTYEKTKGQVPLGSLLGKQNIQATEVYISTGSHVPKDGNSLNTFKNPSSSLTFLKEYGIRLVNVHSI